MLKHSKLVSLGLLAMSTLVSYFRGGSGSTSIENGFNKLGCYIKQDWKGMPGTNTLAYCATQKL